MISTAHPDRQSDARPFSSFTARFILVVLVAAATLLVALHALAPSTASTGSTNESGASTNQLAPQPSEPIYFPGKPY